LIQSPPRPLPSVPPCSIKRTPPPSLPPPLPFGSLTCYLRTLNHLHVEGKVPPSFSVDVSPNRATTSPTYSTVRFTSASSSSRNPHSEQPWSKTLACTPPESRAACVASRSTMDRCTATAARSTGLVDRVHHFSQLKIIHKSC
jgi:hypothetical protein